MYHYVQHDQFYHSDEYTHQHPVIATEALLTDVSDLQWEVHTEQQDQLQGYLILVQLHQLQQVQETFLV